MSFTTDVSAWERHVLYNSGNPAWGAYHIDAGDVDGDGTNDIALLMRYASRVGWLNNNGDSDSWTVTWIDTQIGQPFNVKIADFDKDGQNDVIASSIDEQKVYLYTYSGDPKRTANWSRTLLGTFTHEPCVLHVADIDQDGDLDIIFNNHQYGELEDDLYLLENPYPANVKTEWSKYLIGHYDAREIDVGDIDNDGDLDIVIADSTADSVIWLENNGTTFYENWTEHIVDQCRRPRGYLHWAHGLGLGDIDGDGCLDVAVAAAHGNTFQWYRQINTE